MEEYTLTQVDLQLMENFKEYLLFTYKIDNKLLYIKNLLKKAHLTINDVEIIENLKAAVSVTVKDIDLICTLFNKKNEEISIPGNTIFFIQKLVKYIIQVFNQSDLLDMEAYNLSTDTDYCLLLHTPTNPKIEETMLNLAMQNKEFHAFFTTEIQI